MELTALVDLYCRAWSDPSPERRAELMHAALAPDASYTDPTVHAGSVAELLAHITRVQARRPGSRVERTSQVDRHHGVARFAWHAVEADGNPLPEGIDLIFLSTDGAKIERIIGFFGPVKRGGSPAPA